MKFTTFLITTLAFLPGSALSATDSVQRVLKSTKISKYSSASKGTKGSKGIRSSKGTKGTKGIKSSKGTKGTKASKKSKTKGDTSRIPFPAAERNCAFLTGDPGQVIENQNCPFGNTLDGVVILPLGTTRIDGSFIGPGNADLFKFQVDTFSELVIETKAGGDTHLFLFNERGFPLAEDLDGQGVFEGLSRIEYDFSPGSYVVGVARFPAEPLSKANVDTFFSDTLLDRLESTNSSATFSSDYIVTIDRVSSAPTSSPTVSSAPSISAAPSCAGPFETEPGAIVECTDFGNTVEGAYGLPQGTMKLEGVFDSATKADIVKFSVPNDDRWIIETSTGGDTILVVLDRNGIPLQVNDDFGIAAMSSIDIALMANEDYFLGVTLFPAIASNNETTLALFSCGAFEDEPCVSSKVESIVSLDEGAQDLGYTIEFKKATPAPTMVPSVSSSPSISMEPTITPFPTISPSVSAAPSCVTAFESEPGTLVECNEFGNSLSGAFKVPTGIFRIEGAFNNIGAEVFVFRVPEDGRWVIETLDGGDTALILFDKNGGFLEYNDDSFGTDGLLSEITYDMLAGESYVMAVAAYPETVFDQNSEVIDVFNTTAPLGFIEGNNFMDGIDYVVQISQASASPSMAPTVTASPTCSTPFESDVGTLVECSDFGNTVEGVYELSVGTTRVEGQLEGEAFADLLKFTVSEGGQYNLTTSGEFDSVLMLFDSEAKPLAVNDDRDSSTLLSAIVYDLTPGDYLVAVGFLSLRAFDADGTVVTDAGCGEECFESTPIVSVESSDSDGSADYVLLLTKI